MGLRRSKTPDPAPAAPSGFTPEQRAGQDRLQERLQEARRAPREPKNTTSDPRWAR